MENTDPGAPAYQYDWQKPNLKKFDFGRTFSRTIDILKLRGVRMLVLSSVLIGLPFFLISLWPMFFPGGFLDVIESGDAEAVSELFSVGIIVLLAAGGLLFFIASLWLQPALISISYGALTREDTPTMSVLKQVTRFVLPVFGFFIL